MINAGVSMKDEIETVGKIADATSEVAKTSGKAIDAAADTGKFLSEVFGDVVKDGVGLLADRLKYYRLEKAALLEKKTQNNLKILGIDTLRPLPPKVGLPLIENATLEDNDDLHTLWANLLTSALDPNREEVTKKFVTVLSELSHSEAARFQEIIDLANKVGNGLENFHAAQTNLIPENDDAYRAMMRLGLIKPKIEQLNFGQGLSGSSVPINHDTQKFMLTTFGIAFAKAVAMPTSK